MMTDSSPPAHSVAAHAQAAAANARDATAACTLWSALVEASGCCILMLSDDSRLLFANHAAARLFRLPAHASGASIFEFFPRAMAEERARCARRALERARPVVLVGMIGGVCRRATFYRYQPHPDSPPAALAVCTIIRETDPLADITDAADIVITEVPDMGPLAPLTDRELEVLRLIGRGLSTDDIARTLHRSPKTIEWHRASLGEKLGASNRIMLARAAIDSGLAALDDRTFTQFLRHLPKDRTTEPSPHEPGPMFN